MTSLASAASVGRWRKTSRSSATPIAGATTTTDTTNASHDGQPHAVRAWKNSAADTNAWAPNARLNTPDVL